MRFWLFMFLTLGSSILSAHEMPSLFVGVKEVAHRVYEVHWRIPAGVGVADRQAVTLAPGCERQAPTSPEDGRTLRLSCPDGIAGKTLRLHLPTGAPAVSTMIAVETRSGQRQVNILSPGEMLWQLPEEASLGNIALNYTRLGIAHIWAGIDHLLFVCCLVMLAGSFKRMLITISGFTIAHSITLVLSTLQLVNLPIASVEAAIALSVVFLALEIARGPADTLAWRYPLIVSSLFGLLHGFGFAAVLQEIGLPGTALATGLLFFNLGVEIGQVLFVAGLLLVIIFIEKSITGLRGTVSPRLTTYLNPRAPIYIATSYLVGAMALSWFAERLQVLLSA